MQNKSTVKYSIGSIILLTIMKLVEIEVGDISAYFLSLMIYNICAINSNYTACYFCNFTRLLDQ